MYLLHHFVVNSIFQDLHCHSLFCSKILAPGNFTKAAFAYELQNSVGRGAAVQIMTCLDLWCSQCNCEERRWSLKEKMLSVCIHSAQHTPETISHVPVCLLYKVKLPITIYSEVDCFLTF